MCNMKQHIIINIDIHPIKRFFQHNNTPTHNTQKLMSLVFWMVLMLTLSFGIATAATSNSKTTLTVQAISP